MAVKAIDPLSDLFSLIQKKVDEVKSKTAVANEAEAAFNKASDDLNKSRAELEEIHSQMNAALGNVYSSNTRIRQSE